MRWIGSCLIHEDDILRLGSTVSKGEGGAVFLGGSNGLSRRFTQSLLQMV